MTAFQGACGSARCEEVKDEEEVYDSGGGWTIKRSVPTPLKDGIDDLVRRSGAPIDIDIVSFALERPARKATSLAELKLAESDNATILLRVNAAARAWVAEARRTLRMEGFRTLSPREIAATGFGGGDLGKIAYERLPYAVRIKAQAPSYEFLVKDGGAGCFRGGQGGVAIGILLIGGEVTFFSIGAGDCEFDAGDYLDKAMEAIRLPTN